MPEHQRDRTVADLARDRGPALTSYAYLLTGDVAAAQDLVQDAFVKVFVRSRSGLGQGVAEAYVRRTILTLFVDGYRRRRRWASVRHLVATEDLGADPEASVADRIDLRAALATLAPQERASVVLRFYEDLTVPEIAEQMQVSAGSIKRYLSNAVHKLEVVLGPVEAPADDVEVAVLARAPALPPTSAPPERTTPGTTTTTRSRP
ncbi:sigma-70 family RNA polymerase sigma factor [Cellulomonas sp. KRMCY2]|uniref:sigma-70 family RNA polymerase sigma factor n=1 Tax=Cellulomonas sp. KRMCY2 TaxID=1304865 RepID=UPI00045E93DE|nr:sigma-70 family RNA polymerase sigma factor [Cellulomonas sp. KRMCY2]